jgi:hypothetical protein
MWHYKPKASDILNRYDQDISSKNDHIGRCDLPLSRFLAEASASSIELTLVPAAKQGETPGQGSAGLLTISFECSSVDAVRSRAVRDLFGRFDRDGNGRLDPAEFLQLQSCLSASQRKTSFARIDTNKDGFVDMNELFKVVEELIPDAVVADYYVKEAATPMRLHEVGQKGAALTEEQAGRGWLVSMTEWISRDKCVRLPRTSVCVGLHLCVSASQVTNSDRYGAGLHVGAKADHIVVHNRATGLLEEETIDPALAFSMKALYQTCVDIYLSSPTFSLHTAMRSCSDCSQCLDMRAQDHGCWADVANCRESAPEEDDRQSRPSILPPRLKSKNVCIVSEPFSCNEFQQCVAL